MKRYLYLRIKDGFAWDYKFYVDLSAAQKRAAKDSDYTLRQIQDSYNTGLVLPTSPGFVQIIETEIF